MRLINSHLFFIIGTALVIATRYADQWTSVRGPLYGTREGNPLMRDKYGYFDSRKNWIAAAVIIAVGTALHFFVEPASWIAIFAPVVAGSIWITFKNYGMQQANRLKQTAFLDGLREKIDAGATADELSAHFNNLTLVTTSERSRYVLLGWIFSEERGLDNRIETLQARIIDVAEGSRSGWFRAG